MLENVIPELSLGLIEVAKEMPNDPIEYLAEYLMKKSKEALNFSKHISDGENNSINKFDQFIGINLIII